MPDHCTILPNHWGGCISKVAGNAAASAFDQIANAFGRSAEHATAWLWKQIGAATEVHIGGPGWGKYLAITATLAAVIAIGLFAIQVAASGLRRDTGGLARAARGLLVAFVAGGAAIGVTQILLSATDALSNGIMQVGLGTTHWSTAGALLFGASTLSVLSPSTLLVVSLAMLAAVAIVWVALVVRKLLLIINAVFAPVAFAASLSDVTASWTRKWIEYTLALAFSKVILVMVFVVGLGTLDNNLGGAGNGAPQQVTQIAVGLLLLCVAGLAPWMAVKVVHFAGDAFHEVHAHGQAAAAAGRTAIAGPQKLRNWTQQKSSSGMRGGQSGGDGRQTKPQQSGPRSSSNGSSGSRPPVGAGSPSPGGAGQGPAASEAGSASSAGSSSKAGYATAAAKEAARQGKERTQDAARKGQAGANVVGDDRIAASPAGRQDGPRGGPSQNGRRPESTPPQGPSRSPEGRPPARSASSRSVPVGGTAAPPKGK